LSFTGKVHEQIVPSLQNNNYELLQSSIQINHIGYNISDEEKKNKAQRNLDLLLDDYKHKKSPYTEFQLGQTYSILNNTSEAERYFKLVINSRNISNDLKAESYAYLSHICHNNYNNLASEKYLLTAIDLNPKQAYYYLLLSKIALRKQDYAKAKLYCKKAFEINKDIIAYIKVNAQTILLNPEEVLYFGLYLSYLTNDDNYIDYFFAEFYKIIKSKNQFEKMAVIKTMESILKGKELSELIAHDMIKFIDRNNLDLFIEMIMKQKNPAVMCSILEGLHKVFPQNTSVIKNYSIALEQANNLIQAVELLDKNRELIQKDAGALFYLASFFLRLGNIEKSLEIFTYIENNFKHLSEMLPKIKLIKDKLLALNHQYN